MAQKRRYLRRRESDTWHWRKDCRNYPKQKPSRRGRIIEYRGAKDTPEQGELCNQCEARQRVDDAATLGSEQHTSASALTEDSD